MLSIRSNTMANSALRYLSLNFEKYSKTIERLASGKRIVSAADDPAGSAISSSMRAEIASLRQKSRNYNDQVNKYQSMEGSIDSIGEALTRMKELAEQASTGTYSDSQRRIINAEFNQLAEHIDFVALRPNFNGLGALDGSEEYNMTRAGLGLEGVDILDTDKAQDALDLLDSSIELKNTSQADLGSKVNRYEMRIEWLNVQAENLAEAESRISDVDVATEVTELAKQQVVVQANIAMVAQANEMSKMVLKLL